MSVSDRESCRFSRGAIGVFWKSDLRSAKFGFFAHPSGERIHGSVWLMVSLSENLGISWLRIKLNGMPWGYYYEACFKVLMCGSIWDLLYMALADRAAQIGSDFNGPAKEYRISWGMMRLQGRTRSGEIDSERHMVWSLREPIFRWNHEVFLVQLVRLRSNLDKSGCVFHLFGGNRFGYTWVNGLNGQILWILRFELCFYGMMKGSYLRIAGDIRVLRRSQFFKQIRTIRRLWEDSRLQMISILVGVICLRNKTGNGCLRGMWKLYQPWLSFIFLFRCGFFVGMQLLLLDLILILFARKIHRFLTLPRKYLIYF